MSATTREPAWRRGRPVSGALAWLRKTSMRFRRTPLHPQWFAYREETATHRDVRDNARGLVLDVGCGQRLVRQCLDPGCEYVGLDFLPTAQAWYASAPDVYGDAQSLPIASACVDTVLLLDVLEHLPRPQRALEEAHRILKPGGAAVVQVPYLYPIHDAPLDFQRWSEHALRRLADEHGFSVVALGHFGQPVETSTLLMCIAACKHVLNWHASRNPLVIAMILLPPLILCANLLAWLIGRLSRDDAMMPVGYRLVLRKD